MALTICNFCQKSFSRRFNSCPHCNNKNELYWHFMMQDSVSALAYFGFFYLVVSNFISCSENGRIKEQEIEACTSRGIAYFKEVGSYPVLHYPPEAGRSAEEVAKERCNRTTTAFQ
jgi:hypothetical protein